MGSVPGTNSCPFADVVTVVPSQAAACDTALHKVKRDCYSGFFQPTRTDQKSSKKFYKILRGHIVSLRPRNCTIRVVLFSITYKSGRDKKVRKRRKTFWHCGTIFENFLISSKGPFIFFAFFQQNKC